MLVSSFSAVLIAALLTTRTGAHKLPRGQRDFGWLRPATSRPNCRFGWSSPSDAARYGVAGRSEMISFHSKSHAGFTIASSTRMSVELIPVPKRRISHPDISAIGSIVIRIFPSGRSIHFQLDGHLVVL